MKTALYLGGPLHGRIAFTYDMNEDSTVQKQFAPHASIHHFTFKTHQGLHFLVHQAWNQPQDWQTVANELIEFFHGDDK